MVFLELLRFQLEFVFVIGTQIRLKCSLYRGDETVLLKQFTIVAASTALAFW
jgi:hypothetical protein